jgi:peptidase inhibitor family I36
MAPFVDLDKTERSVIDPEGGVRSICPATTGADAGIANAISPGMTKRTLVILDLGLFTLCGAAANASAQPRWGRERMPQNGACFFENRDFGGRYFCVRPGEDLRSLPNGMGDRISSMRLLGTSAVTVFRDSDLRGRSARFSRDVTDLRRDGWNDQISSLAVSPSGFGGNGRGRGRDRDYDDDLGYGGWNPRAPAWGRQTYPREGACFFEDANFRGDYFCVPRGGTYTALPRGFNDRISSVRVFGAGVRIYQDRDFHGRSTEIRRNASDLRGNWRDSISSIRVF